ncbi:MAG TPA: multiheme c-type cytochrome [Gemmata sp.]|nr:multiheme c-type cytochrome [Gemmata sp.]
MFALRRPINSDSPSALRPDPPTPDPRVTFPTQFKNVRPGVKYLGDTSCAGCHSTISGTYHAHPMGRSAEWVSHKGANDILLAGANNPFTVAGYTLQVEKEGDRIVHRMSAIAPDESKLPAYAMPIDLVIGSGTHGRSYLSVDQGSVWQSPISWYHEGQRWDVSPGIDLGTNSRRPITADCFHCHVNRIEAIPNALNRYSESLLTHQANIGCERCHGPGELHVAERSGSSTYPNPDYSIVNPKHLPSDLKSDICRQCHLQGQAQIPRRGRVLSEYRPGLPWDQFATTAIPNPELADYRKAVGQFEQMERSKCITANGESLSCTNCHDPHFKPPSGGREAYFRARCVSCHDTRRCTLPLPERQAKNDSCIVCHMPQKDSSNIVHTAITDHRIMKRPDDGRPRSQILLSGQFPIVLYRAGPHAPPPEERERDWAIALGFEIGRGSPGGSSERWSLTKAKFDSALERWPGDAPVWGALAEAYRGRSETTRALEAAKNAAGLCPDGETYLMGLAVVAQTAGEHELSIATANKLIDMNPLNPDHLLLRGTANASLKQWRAVEADARAALAIHPLEPRAHLLLGLALNGSGNQAKGQDELEVALKLAPSSQTRSSLLKYWQQAR